MIRPADDKNMRRLSGMAEDFFDRILRPDEDPGFVSDEATLLDISLAPEADLIEKVYRQYGRTLTSHDFRRPFWSLLQDLYEESFPPRK